MHDRSVITDYTNNYIVYTVHVCRPKCVQFFIYNCIYDHAMYVRTLNIVINYSILLLEIIIYTVYKTTLNY